MVGGPAPALCTTTAGSWVSPPTPAAAAPAASPSPSPSPRPVGGADDDDASVFIISAVVGSVTAGAALGCVTYFAAARRGAASERLVDTTMTYHATPRFVDPTPTPAALLPEDGPQQALPPAQGFALKEGGNPPPPPTDFTARPNRFVTALSLPPRAPSPSSKSLPPAPSPTPLPVSSPRAGAVLSAPNPLSAKASLAASQAGGRRPLASDYAPTAGVLSSSCRRSHTDAPSVTGPALSNASRPPLDAPGTDALAVGGRGRPMD